MAHSAVEERADKKSRAEESPEKAQVARHRTHGVLDKYYDHRVCGTGAGHEDENPKSSSSDDEAEGIIPALDQKLAEWLQAELLKRADIQKTIQINNGNQPSNSSM